MTKLITTTPKPPVKGRIRPALRTAIRLLVEEGYTQVDAAKAVGMRQESLSVALKKPYVVALRGAVKRAWLDNATSKAWVTIATLANEAVSEDVRLKAAKLFLEAAGELNGGAGADKGGPRSLVQILINHPVGASASGSTLPGVIEIVRKPGRSSDPYQVIEA
jgi:hypothetical protein